MRKISVLAGILLALTASEALAQTEVPVVTKRAVTHAEFVRSFDPPCDRTVLIAPCAELLWGVNKEYPGLRLSSVMSLQEYFRRLESRPCPQFPGETCLYDKWAERDIVSLGGNAAPATQGRSRGKAFLDEPFSTPQEYAEMIRKCDQPGGSPGISCAELVRSFNLAFDDIEDVANKDELADFIEKTKVKPCPRVETRIARVVDGRVDLEYTRLLREGERCLYDSGSARYVSSMSCGQWIPDKHPVYTAMNEDDASKSELPRSILAPAAARGGQEIAQKMKSAEDEHVGEKGGNPFSRFSRWYGRNKKVTVPATILTVAAAALAVRRNVNETTVTVTVR